jgi:hypothetical protein
MRIWQTGPYQPNAWEPAAAIGIVAYRRDDGKLTAEGSCFRFGHDDVALTAAHCVPANGAAGGISVLAANINRRTSDRASDGGPGGDPNENGRQLRPRIRRAPTRAR